MLFVEKIKQLRESRQLPQRQLAAILEIDTATYCKIEHGDRKAKREQVVIIANILKISEDELLTLWLADQVCSVLKYEQNVNEVLNVVQENIEEYGKKQDVK
ncbi:MAG: helix-turn-helix transcriptional regulator [Bacteroidales bacterium]|nr:helix-turn-helix transcriptional regulator [Bacteroidales bacterium]